MSSLPSLGSIGEDSFAEEEEDDYVLAAGDEPEQTDIEIEVHAASEEDLLAADQAQIDQKAKGRRNAAIHKTFEAVSVLSKMSSEERQDYFLGEEEAIEEEEDGVFSDNDDDYYYDPQTAKQIGALRQWVNPGKKSGAFLRISDKPELLCKHLNEKERGWYQKMEDSKSLEGFRPKFFGVTDLKDEAGVLKDFIVLEDVLHDFDQASLWAADIKIGFTSEAPDVMDDEEGREDLYSKLQEVGALELPHEMVARGSATELEFMVVLDNHSTTGSCGFRLDGVRLNTGPAARSDLCAMKMEELLDYLAALFEDRPVQCNHVVKRLQDLIDAMMNDELFKEISLFGGTLMIAHDDTGKVGVFMTDFSQMFQRKQDMSHQSSSIDEVLETSDDGYIAALCNLQRLITQANEEEQ